MKKLLFLSLLLLATPLFAQRRVDVFFDLEGVRKTGGNRSFAPGARFVPEFDTGGGIGGGINWFLTDRVSVETKVAAVTADMSLSVVTPGTAITFRAGDAKLYPISAMIQWHMAERRMLRPYLAVGAVHTILKDIDRNLGVATGIRFKNPTGLAVGGGLEISFGRRWSIFGDARYVPIETEARATFVGTPAMTVFNAKPLIVSTGISYSVRR